MFDLSDLQEKNRLFDMLEKKRRFGEINRRFIRLKWRVILPKGRFGFLFCGI